MMQRLRQLARRRPVLCTTLVYLFAGAIALAGWRAVESHEPELAAHESATAGQGAAQAGTLTLNADDLARSGVRSAPLRAANGPGLVQAFATVVDIAPLNELRNAMAGAQAQLVAGRAKAEASRAAWQRAAALYRDGQNMSLAQVQVAEATSRADQASASAAAVQLQSALATARQQFGPVLAQVASPQASALARGQAVLLQITGPADTAFTPPPALTVTPVGEQALTAGFVSQAMRADPRLQGPSAYYLAPAGRGLQAGMNVAAAWPAGPAQAGVLLPDSAVVAWQGQWWAYERVGQRSFRRISVDTSRPLPGGYLVRALPAGVQVVTQGAQLLLSQELKPQSQAAAGDDD